MICGAAWHMPLTGGCSARKSPPFRVSLTWISGESPSPLVLTAPLIPPCAQTEWLRLTGTTEKRSTDMPISAARTVAIRPASPPPTIKTRWSVMGPPGRETGNEKRKTNRLPVALASDSSFPVYRFPFSDSQSDPERRNRAHSNERQNQENDRRHVHHSPLRVRADGQPPHDREGPDAVGQVKGRRENPRYVKGVDPGIGDGCLHLPEEI